MAYRLKQAKSVQKGLRQAATDQLDKAIGELTDVALDDHKKVHQVRKRCKKIRGLIRLVRPKFPAYQGENKFFRNAAGKLSYVRDAQTILDCFDELLEHFEDPLERNAFGAIREELEGRRQEIAHDKAGLQEKLQTFLEQLRQARERVAKWKVKDDGFSALAGGLKKTYARGRCALRTAYKEPSTENFHQWRKRVKYHWYHARLLRDIWPEMMNPHIAAAHNLSNLLGEDHDLAVLHATLLAEPESFGEASELQPLLNLVDRRRAALQARANPLGRRLFAEKPAALAERWQRYWKLWRSTRELPPEAKRDPNSALTQTNP